MTEKIPASATSVDLNHLTTLSVPDFFFRIIPFLLCGYEISAWNAEVGMEDVKMNML